jgi:hypothetical protein
MRPRYPSASVPVKKAVIGVIGAGRVDRHVAFKYESGYNHKPTRRLN